jgi:transposase
MRDEAFPGDMSADALRTAARRLRDVEGACPSSGCVDHGPAARTGAAQSTTSSGWCATGSHRGARRSTGGDSNPFWANEAVSVPDEDRRASDVGAEPDAEILIARKRRGGWRKELPANLPRECLERDLSDAEKLCPCCGRPRERFGIETSEQLEYIPASLKVLQHVRFKYACRGREEHVAIALSPSKPIEKGPPGPGLLAQVLVSKASEHLPCYQQEDTLARNGVEIPRQTLCRWLREAADRLAPLVSLMARRVRQSCVINADDTTVAVLDRTLPHTRTGRFWIYAGDADPPYFVCDYTSSRRRDGPATFLADYTGYFQAEAFSGYDGIYASHGVMQVLCWAHPRRKFFDARAGQPIKRRARWPSSRGFMPWRRKRRPPARTPSPRIALPEKRGASSAALCGRRNRCQS